MILKTRAFLELVSQHTLASLRQEAPQLRLRSSMLQVYFGSPYQHYEVWLRQKDALIEIGLHFEGDHEENLRRLSLLANVMPEIVTKLGVNVDIEEWTASWTRLHEVRPLPVLDEESAAEIGRRLASYIRVLQPLVGPLGQMPAPQAMTAPREGRWRRGSRARAGARS